MHTVLIYALLVRPFFKNDAIPELGLMKLSKSMPAACMLSMSKRFTFHDILVQTGPHANKVRVGKTAHFPYPYHIRIG